MTYPTSLP